MELGPNQLKWIAALRSGEYRQGQDFLNKGGNFCCLGVACDIFKDKSTRIRAAKYGNQQEFIEYDGESTLAPRYVVDSLSLRSIYGANCTNPDKSLVRMNDSGKTFIHIANTIEANPSEYFKESV